MKRISAYSLCFLLGVSLGWDLGYTRPNVKNQRKLLKEYETVRDGFRLTDTQMVEVAAYLPLLPELREDVKRSDEFAAAVDLNAVGRLEHGNTEGAKELLLTTVAKYYQRHRHDGDTNLLAKMERVAATNATIAYWLTNRLE
jgi:hypothetical protein